MDKVYILNQRGQPLMPCSPVKARILLKQGKARVIKRTPFTVQLTIGTGENKQPLMLGVDTGYQNVGLSAMTDKQELFTAEVHLRTNISKLLSERRMYRQSRRARKTRYRKPRFLNRVRTRHRGWLSPSVQHKLDSHIKLVQKVHKILPITKVVVEVANFDIQKINNPSIHGKDYHCGEQLDFNNVREYVLYRDNHTCQHCKGKTKDVKLNTHHIIPRNKGGTNKPDNLITLCKTCHNKLHKNEIVLNIKSKNTFKAETFMSIIRWKIVDRLRELYKDVEITYGYSTKTLRCNVGLIKSHINDSFIIGGGTNQIRSRVQYLVKQVRKQNRKLFKGARSHIKNTASRFMNSFQRYDKVLHKGIECFIHGRRITGYFDIRLLNGTKIRSSVKYTNLKLLESFSTLLWEVNRIPPLDKSRGLLRGRDDTERMDE